MKKISLLILVSMILLLAFTSCTVVFKDKLPSHEEPAHEHSFGEAWESDSLIHFHKCECGEKTAVAAHSDENSDNVCDVCSYALPVELATLVVTVEVAKEDGSTLFGNTFTVKEGEDAVFDLMVGVEYTLTAGEGVTLLSTTTNNGVETYTFKVESVTEDVTVSILATLCTHCFADATCTTAKTCELCTLVVGDPLGHDWVDADCVTAKTCATCGETDGEALGHTPGVYASCLDPQLCEVCGDVLVAALGHDRVEIPGVEATCTSGGMTTGYVCGLCSFVLVEQENIAPLGHKPGEWIVDVAPTCTTTGTQHKECQTCGATTKTESMPALGHTSGEAVVENEVDPDCVNNGSYDSVVYCTVCEGRVSKTTVPVPALGHTPGEAVVENEVDPDCVNAGSYDSVVYCTVCEEVVSKTTVPVSALGHTDGEAVVENEVDPDCVNNGSYDSVVYCTVCKEVVSKTTVPVAPLGHKEVDAAQKDATCTSAGLTAGSVCANDCGFVFSGRETIPALGHDDGNSDYKCDRCSAKVLPADGTALTITEALAIAKLHEHNTYTTQKYYITGIITNVYNTQYGNMYIKDADGNEIVIYGLYSADGKTRYDALSYKPTVGDEITVYTPLGTYNGTAQGKSAWLDEVVIHEEHKYDIKVTAPTCTLGGYTTYTCIACGYDYKSDNVDPLGHTTENGECERCHVIIGSGTVVYDTFKADFNTIANTNSSYIKSTTKDGWVATNCAVMGGGTSNSNPKFQVFGDASTRAFTMNGKTTAKGSIVSPTLQGGLSNLSFNYTYCFGENKIVDITITIKQNGEVVASKNVYNNTVTQFSVHTLEWDLLGENIAVTGDFTIEITNNSPSKSTSNKDRVSIWNLEWTNNPTA